MPDATAADLAPLLANVRERFADGSPFASVDIVDGRLDCRADGSAEPATYRLEAEGGRVWVALVMEDRWQSESIEADLMHTGDKLEELIAEELVDLDHPGDPAVTYEHFRSEDMLFTFRSPLPIDPGALADPASADLAALWLRGYEAAFRQLGDMDADGSDD